MIRYAHDRGLLVLLDGKRNDIGSTATAYAQGYLVVPPASPWGADALTVSPYLGDDSLDPFVEVARHAAPACSCWSRLQILAGKLFQDLYADGRPLYQHVAALVERLAIETQATAATAPWAP